MDSSEAIEQDGQVLISGSDPQWLVGLSWLLGCIAILLGGIRCIQRIDPPALVFLSIGVLLIVGGIILGVHLRFKRRYLRPTPDGFVYTVYHSERTFRDDDVMCVSLLSQENYSFGNLRGITDRFVMWVETTGLPEPIVCTTRRSPLEAGPLQPFINRIVGELYRAARSSYLRGERVEGDGWAMERDRLLLKLKNSTVVCDVQDLAAVEVIDQHINIWRRDQDLPIGRVSVVTANSQLLLLLLREFIPQEFAEQEQDLPEGNMGRILFIRRGLDHVLTFMLWVVAVALSLATAGATLRIFFGQRPGARRRAVPWAVFFGLLTSVVVWILRSQRQTYFRRHLFGVCQRGLFGERRLRFRDIANFSYSAQRQYSHGLYRGTTVTLAFTPTPGLGLKPIRFATTVQNTDPELDRLRDDISEVIAERMARFFQEHGECPWTQFLKFTQNGLEYRSLTITGRKPPIRIPYQSIVNFTIEEGGFHLWVKDQKKSFVNEDVSHPNFFPGLIFMSQLIQQSAQQDDLTASTAQESNRED